MVLIGLAGMCLCGKITFSYAVLTVKFPLSNDELVCCWYKSNVMKQQVVGLN